MRAPGVSHKRSAKSHGEPSLEAKQVAPMAGEVNSFASPDPNHEGEVVNSTADPWAPLLLSTNAIPSYAQQVTADEPISMPLMVNQHPKPGDRKPVAMEVEAIATVGTSASSNPGPGLGTDEVASSGESEELSSRFYIVLHLPEAKVKMFICHLDTAADADILSQKVVDNLGMKMDPYEGGSLHPLGAPIQPIGQLTLDWHVAEFSKTYTTTFVVLDPHSTRSFDALLGFATLRRIGFYVKNKAVWYLGSENLEDRC